MDSAVPTGWKPVARVNGALLIERDLVREMYTIFPYAKQHNGFPKQLEPEIRNGALQMIIFDELVYQEAKRRQMVVPTAELAKAEAEFRKQFPNAKAYEQFLATEANGSQAVMRDKIRRALVIDKLLKQEIDDPARVTTAQARSNYQKNIAQYKHEELLHIQSISIIPPNQTRAVVTEAKQRAEKAAQQSKQAKSYHEFGLLAEKMSDDDFHVNMGDHKITEASKLPPPVVAAAKTMKPGDVSNLIQLGNYYTIFRLEARVPAGTTSFEEVKAKLQSDMQKEREQRLRSAFGEKLRKGAKIEIL
jgi:parvulin-like peptidyl-prolyl isomerase